MASSETYTQYLKPTEKELLEVQAGYEELEKLLKSSSFLVMNIKIFGNIKFC